MRHFHLILFIYCVSSCQTNKKAIVNCPKQVESLLQHIIQHHVPDEISIDTLKIHTSTFPIIAYRSHTSQVEYLLVQNKIPYDKKLWKDSISYALNKSNEFDSKQEQLIIKYDRFPKRLPNSFNRTAYASFGLKKLEAAHWLVFFTLQKSNLDGETRLFLVKQVDCSSYSILAESVISVS